jgi:hypothetical protein
MANLLCSVFIGHLHYCPLKSFIADQSQKKFGFSLPLHAAAPTPAELTSRLLSSKDKPYSGSTTLLFLGVMILWLKSTDCTVEHYHYGVAGESIDSASFASH